MHVVMIVGLLAWAAIIYTYLLFPLILACLARLPGLQRGYATIEANDDYLPDVTMVLAAYNEEDVMAAKLANTWNIDYPPDRFHVIIGSDGSEDGTNAILAACNHPQLRKFLFAQRRGKISVLNELVEHVTSEIIVMSDASTMFAPDAVRKLVRRFQHPQVGCVTGELSIQHEGGSSGEGLYLRYERWIKRSEGRLGCVIGCVGAIFAIRRSLYDRLPANTITEDFVLCMRVVEHGFLAESEPEARAVDPASAGNREEVKRKIRIGAGNFQAIGLTRAALHPRYGLSAFAYWSHKVLRWLVPAFFLIGLGANLVLSRYALCQALIGLQALGAVIAWRAYNAPPGAQLPRWMRPISYFYLMNYALLLGLFRFLSGTQRVTWERALEQPLVSAAPDAPAIPYTQAVGASEANQENRERRGNDQAPIDIAAVALAEQRLRNRLAVEPDNMNTRVQLAWSLFIGSLYAAGCEAMSESAPETNGEEQGANNGPSDARRASVLLRDCLRQAYTVSQLSLEPEVLQEADKLKTLIELCGAHQARTAALQDLDKSMADLTHAVVHAGAPQKTVK
jgi:cellulose synthase/poly-beta-1,6-N-acetylglucosamine synthase-like glycosyltransferase